jgi:hypothetical protein
MQPLTPPEPRGAWWVVAAAFCSLALIFGVSYSFAAFFTDFSSEFQVPRADVSWVCAAWFISSWGWAEA